MQEEVEEYRRAGKTKHATHFALNVVLWPLLVVAPTLAVCEAYKFVAKLCRVAGIIPPKRAQAEGKVGYLCCLVIKCSVQYLPALCLYRQRLTLSSASASTHRDTASTSDYIGFCSYSVTGQCQTKARWASHCACQAYPYTYCAR